MMSNFKNILVQGFHPFFRAVAISSFLFFCYLSFLRVFEYLFLFSNGIIETRHFWVLIKSINYDLNATSLWFLISFPFFLLLNLISDSFSYKLHRTVLLFFLIVSIVLNYYFYINKELLGFNVFSYSFDEIYLIVAHELVSLNVVYGIITGLIVFIAIYFFIYKSSYTYRFKGDWVIVLLVTVIGIVNLCQLKYSSPVSREYVEAIEYNLAYNKVDFIVRGGITSKLSSGDSELDLVAVEGYQQLVPADYLSVEFPFMKKRRETNELGSFFNEKSGTPPNIIFVISESLSRVFSGPGAKYVGITPYLDSLVDNSLYWRNFIANCSRTYGVLPNVLGSLPYGNKARGFQTIQSPYPKHQTLLSLLTKQGYSAEFYYPGWGGFDNVTEFMFVQGVTKNYDRDHFETEVKPSASWGFSDRQLFELYLNDLDKKEAPFVHTLLTLSIHSPYDQAEEKHNKAAEVYAENLVNEHLTSLEKNVLANAMYFDECIKFLVEGLKKSRHYENTILVITGDHNVQNLPLRNEIDRFYVPLYINSPLLKKHQNIGGVCSHLDITPSFVQLLADNYKVPMPEEVAFVGYGLDTSKVFNAERIFPLTVYSEGIGNYVYKNMFLTGGQTYSLKEGLTMTPLSNVDVDLSKLRSDYISLDKYVSNQKKLMR